MMTGCYRREHERPLTAPAVLSDMGADGDANDELLHGAGDGDRSPSPARGAPVPGAIGAQAAALAPAAAAAAAAAAADPATVTAEAGKAPSAVPGGPSSLRKQGVRLKPEGVFSGVAIDLVLCQGPWRRVRTRRAIQRGVRAMLGRS